MKLLEDYIRQNGQIINEHVLKVDSFLNHQVDPQLMKAIADDFKEHFKDKKVTKVVTVETSGIAPSLFLAYALNVPLVFMKKSASRIMQDDNYMTTVHSFTKDIDYELMVSKKYLNSDDHVIFVDDFMANGEACLGAIRLIEDAKASLEGIGIVIEKSFQDGRKKLEDKGYDVYALARVKAMKPGFIEFISED